MNNSDSASILASDVSVVPTDVTSSQAHVIAVVSVAGVLLVLVLLNLAALLLYTRARHSLKHSDLLDGGQSYHYQLSAVDEDSHRHSYRPQSLQASASTQTTGVYKAARRDGSKKRSKRRRSEGRAIHVRSKSRRRRFEEEEENRVNAQMSAGGKLPLEGDDHSKSSSSTVIAANAAGTVGTPNLPGRSPTGHSQPRADGVISMPRAKSDSALTSTVLQVSLDAVASSTSDSASLGWRVEQSAMRPQPLPSESLVAADKNTWIPITSARKTTLTSQSCSSSSPRTPHTRHVAEGAGTATRSHSEVTLHGQAAPDKQASLSASLKKRYLETWQKAKNSIYGKHVTGRKARPSKPSDTKAAKETRGVAASSTAVKTNRAGHETNVDKHPQTPRGSQTPTTLHHTSLATSRITHSKATDPTGVSSRDTTPNAPQPSPPKSTDSKFRDLPPDPKRKDSQISTATTATDDSYDNNGEIHFVGVERERMGGEAGGVGVEDRTEVLLRDPGLWPMEAHNHALCFTAGLTSISSDDFDEIEL